MKRILILMPAVLALAFLSLPTLLANVETKRDLDALKQKQRQALDELLPKLSEASLNDDSVPTWLSGDLGIANGNRKAAAVEVMRRLSPVFRAEAEDQFEPKSEQTDKLGQTHVRMQQRYLGLPVIGGDLIVHMQAERIIGVNGNFIPDINLDIIPVLAPDAAVAAAMPTPSFETKKHSSPELVVYTARKLPHLAWRQAVSYVDFGGQLQSDMIYADARTGELLGQSPLFISAKVREIYDGSLFCSSALWPLIFQESASGGTPADPSALAAYNNTGRAYDFYKNVFNRDSYDDNGATLKSQIHMTMGAGCGDKNVMNWSPFFQTFQFGDGDEITYKKNPASSISLVAHEFTHAALEQTAYANYEREPGALSESFADVMGIAAEHYSTGTTIWELGADAYTPAVSGDALRYLNDPAADLGQNYFPNFPFPNNTPYPPNPNIKSADFYPELLPCPKVPCSAAEIALGFCPSYDPYKIAPPGVANDYCWVHFNNGIGNLAFYLASVGGTHPRGKTSISVTGIGIEQTRQIWYRAFTTYIIPFSNYADARSATVHAAADLYGYCSQAVQSVQSAWDAVGVPRNYVVNTSSGPANIVGACLSASRCDLNLLSDPGFEKGSWPPITSNKWITNPTIVAFDSNFFDYSSSGPPPHSGNKKAKFGSFTTLPQTMYQEVTLLPGMKKARLCYWIRAESLDFRRKAELRVEIRNTSNNLIGTVAIHTNMLSLGTYWPMSFDITPFISGQQKVRLYFNLVENEPLSSGGMYTKFYIDDVAFVVY